MHDPTGVRYRPKCVGLVMLLRLVHNLPLLAALVESAFGVVMTVRANRELHAYREYQKSIAGVEVSAPSGFPDQSQTSVDIAMVMFSIETPDTVDGPEFDSLLGDRGLTTGGLILPQKRVTIGPAAFTSWGVLGSTLAHEIEVHVPQSFFKVVAIDQLTQWSLSARRLAGRVIPALQPSAKELFENDGTWSAEREAYMHEVRNAKRFGLTNEEIDSIWRVMDYYYPKQRASDSSHLSASSQNSGNSSESEREDVKASDL